LTSYSSNVLPSLIARAGQEISGFERDLVLALNDQSVNLDSILNRGIKFTDNVDCRIVDYASNATPDAEDTLAHGLGKVPTGYIVIGKDKAGTVYDGTTAWTATNIYLKCDTASVAAKLIVF
jgi:hypothetical protein